MKRIEYLVTIMRLFQFRTVLDEEGNEYVLLKENDGIPSKNVEDKTEFEAVHNHVHLFDYVKKNEFDALIAEGKLLGRTLLENLNYRYPEKRFFVFVTVSLNDSMIVRFHQIWDGEEPYYNPADFDPEKDRVLMFQTELNTGDASVS